MKKRTQNKSLAALACLGLLALSLVVEGNKLAFAASSDPMPLTSGFGRGVQRVFRVTSLARIIGERVLAKQIHKKTQGEVDVDLTPYSATDLAKGKVKRLSVHGKNLVVDKAFYVSQFDLVTDEDTPVWVELKHGKLQRPVEADFKITLTEKDMAQTFETTKLQKKLARIKAPVLGGGAKRLHLTQPVVLFAPEGIRLSGTLAFDGASPEDVIPLVVDSALDVNPETQKPRFSKVRVESGSPKLDASFLTPLMEEALGFVSDPDKLIPMDKAKLRVRKITMTDDRLTMEGHVWLVATAKIPN